MLISQKIFAWMKQRGMTQKEFSERTGISQSTISDWKRKNTNPSADKVLKICEVLRVTPYELLSETDMEDMPLQINFNNDLSRDEYILIKDFRKLNVKQKQRVFGYLEALSDRE